ncbi:MAG: HlyD family secretion protein, partial [Deltaproteobacteria bacterium]
PPLDWHGAGFASDFRPEMRPVGFQPAPQPARIPARFAVPRMRSWVAGITVITLALVGVNWVWSITFQYVAMGIVGGQSLILSSEAEGTVQEVLASEGHPVRCGQVLLALENQAWRHELERLRDERRIALADVAAEESQLRWQQEVAEHSRPRVRADYHEAQGRLKDEEARLEALKSSYVRYQQLKRNDAVSLDTLDRARLELKGQAAKVAELRIAVQELESRAEHANTAIADRETQLAPKRERVEFLNGEITRWEQRIAQLQIRSPVDGVVLARFHHPGEWIAKNESLFSLLKAGTQEIVLYLPQSKARGFEPRDEIAVADESCGIHLAGTIARIDPQLQKAPESIAKFYRHGEHLAAVHVAPDPRAANWPVLPVGGVVRLPLFNAWKPHRSRT